MTPDSAIAAPTDAFSAEKAGAALFAEFPELRKNTLIFTSADDIVTHKDAISRLPSGEFSDPADEIHRAVAKQQPCVLRFGERTEQGYVKSYANIIVVMMDGVQSTIDRFLQRGKEIPRFLAVDGKENILSKWLWACFDHESGHVLTREGLAKSLKRNAQLDESMADAYAMIRHFQRFGADSKFPEIYANLRRYRTINLYSKSNAEHETSRAIAEVCQLNGEGKIAGLTPDESRQLAVTIGLKTALSPDEKYSLSAAFNRKASVAELSPDSLDRHIERLSGIGRSTASPCVHGEILSYLKSLPQLAADRAYDAARLKEAVETMENNRPSAEPLRPAWRRIIFGRAPMPARPHLKAPG